MSWENVSVIREVIEAWNAGDMTRVRELYDPDAIVRTPPEVPEAGPHVGRDAVMRFFGQLREAVDARDSFDLVSDSFAVSDRVLVRVAWKGTGSGPAINLEMTLLYTVRRGHVFELEYFLDHAEALEAVGLRE
jgi:ketosteroid isomerase-like protein